MEHIIGVDFGTTNTVAAIITPSGPKIILDHEGNNLTPSVVAMENGELVVGYAAKENSDAFSKGNAVKEIKRKIGTNQTVKLGSEQYKPFEIASLILKKVKRNVEIHLGEHVKKAIITVPAEFSDAQRNEIMQAGKIAGFEVELIINEPTAAIMSFVYNKSLTSGTVLCYDFGGGTFDVSVADIHNRKITVRCVGGDRNLGGSDIDQNILTAIKSELESTKRIKLSDKGLHELYLAVEKLKINLSDNEVGSINGSFSTTTGSKVSFLKKMERTAFETLISPHIDQTINKVKELLNENGINPKRDIDYILLVGGSSQIPLVTKKLQILFGKKPTTDKVTADISVAVGAALEANNRSITKVIPGTVEVEDVSPYTIGLKIGMDGESDVFDPIIRKNFPYGREYSEKYDTALDYQKTMLLQIYQGENRSTMKNEHICDLVIDGIPEREAGKESVRVSFIYDQNGIININATILSTGKRITKSVTYESKSFIGQTLQGKTKIEGYFTSDKQFSDDLKLKKQLDKFRMSAESTELEEALKNDDKKGLKRMRASLLDE